LLKFEYFEDYGRRVKISHSAEKMCEVYPIDRGVLPGIPVKLHCDHCKENLDAYIFEFDFYLLQECIFDLF
jgi:hypothetical protein